MNSFKLVLAALMLGVFSLSITGCPSKKEEAPAATEMMDDSAEMTDETTDEMAEEAE